MNKTLVFHRRDNGDFAAQIVGETVEPRRGVRYTPRTTVYIDRASPNRPTVSGEVWECELTEHSHEGRSFYRAKLQRFVAANAAQWDSMQRIEQATERLRRFVASGGWVKAGRGAAMQFDLTALQATQDPDHFNEGASVTVCAPVLQVMENAPFFGLPEAGGQGHLIRASGTVEEINAAIAAATKDFDPTITPEPDGVWVVETSNFRETVTITLESAEDPLKTARFYRRDKNCEVFADHADAAARADAIIAERGWQR